MPAAYYIGSRLHQSTAALARRPAPAPHPEAYRRGLAAMARAMGQPAQVRPPVQVRPTLAPPPSAPSLHRILATMGAIDAMAKDRQRIEKKLSTRLDKAKASRQKTMDAKAAGAKIGVDTGRLVNSLTPGVGTSALAATAATATAAAQTATTATSAGAGDTLLQTGANHVTVGTNVNYAPYFDEDRPIFGPHFLSPARRAVLERLVVDATERHLKKALRDKT